jgi:hypothetical protein
VPAWHRVRVHRARATVLRETAASPGNITVGVGPQHGVDQLAELGGGEPLRPLDLADQRAAVMDQLAEFGL